MVCRALSLRDDLLPGFAEAVAEFEDWVPVLVLRAAQSLGLFKRPGAAATPEQLSGAGSIVPQYGRFIAEMLAILHRAGAGPGRNEFLQSDPAQHSPGKNALFWLMHLLGQSGVRQQAPLCYT